MKLSTDNNVVRRFASPRRLRRDQDGPLGRLRRFWPTIQSADLPESNLVLRSHSGARATTATRYERRSWETAASQCGLGTALRTALAVSLIPIDSYKCYYVLWMTSGHRTRRRLLGVSERTVYTASAQAICLQSRWVGSGACAERTSRLGSLQARPPRKAPAPSAARIPSPTRQHGSKSRVHADTARVELERMLAGTEDTLRRRLIFVGLLTQAVERLGWAAR